MIISDKANIIISALENAGYEAFFVGGCVRDCLMNRQCNDIDITTSAKPEELESVLNENGIKYVETGIKHGTVTAVLDTESFEITTYRTDGEYLDSRHPESVKFSCKLEDDLSRRDFTINAMAYNKSRGLVDAFSGASDLKNKLIKAVGDPDKRFKEDALRIMRAIRFSSVLGFEIEENTKKALFDNKELLLNISSERIFSELSKLLLGNNVYSVLTEYKDIIAVVIPEIKPMFNCAQNNPWHLYDVWEHTCKSVAAAPESLKIRLTMLFHDLGKPASKTTDENGINHFKGHQQLSAELADGILKRFKVSNEIYNFLMTIIPVHDISVSTQRNKIKKLLNKLGTDINGEYYLNSLLQVKRADKSAQNLERTQGEIEKLDCISKLLEDIIESSEALTVKDLKINGNDLKSLGMSGREIGEALEFLLENVIDGNVNNEKTALMKYIKKTRLP